MVFHRFLYAGPEGCDWDVVKVIELPSEVHFTLHTLLKHRLQCCFPRFETQETQGCHWDVVKVIKLPSEAYFMDYAGIAFNNGGHGKRVAVVSQEDAAVW